MKKFAMILVAALATTLTACSSGGGTPDIDTSATAATEIDLVYAYDKLFTAPLTEITERVQRESGIKVNLVLAGESYEDADRRIQTDLATGKPPALAMVGLNRLQPYVESARAVPIEPFIDSTPEFDVNDFDPKFLDLMRVDGQLQGMPYGVSTPVLYINSDAFRKAGLDPAAPPSTWEDVEKAARQLTSTGTSKYGVHWAWDMTGNWTFQAMVDSNGGSLLSADRTEVTFDQKPAVEAAEYLSRQVSDGLMPMMGESEARDAFARGDIPMLITSTSYLAGFEKSAAFDFRTAPFPAPATGQAKVPGGGNGFMILADDPSQQVAAWTVLRALTDIEGSTTTVKATGYMPVNEAAMASESHLAEFVREPNRRTSLDQIPALVPWLNFPGTHGREATDAIKEALFTSMRGEKSPQQALSDAADSVRGMLK